MSRIDSLLTQNARDVDVQCRAVALVRLNVEEVKNRIQHLCFLISDSAIWPSAADSQLLLALSVSNQDGRACVEWFIIIRIIIINILSSTCSIKSWIQLTSQQPSRGATVRQLRARIKSWGDHGVVEKRRVAAGQKQRIHLADGGFGEAQEDYRGLGDADQDQPHKEDDDERRAEADGEVAGPGPDVGGRVLDRERDLGGAAARRKLVTVFFLEGQFFFVSVGG